MLPVRMAFLPEDRAFSREDLRADEESQGGVDNQGSVDQEHQSRVYLARDYLLGCSIKNDVRFTD